MIIKIGNYYLNDDDIMDPYLTPSIDDASIKNSNQVENFIHHFTTYEGESLWSISSKSWVPIFVKDIEIL